ncbi:urease accessory protein [Mesocricetibacter intestinalis]|uniref:Urease accessory protein UreD n=1 Tax=Mesocricetibacter intestinalis TaxID=1521930 RepID=A0A4R6V6P3_9PAST|nr:urease accessory protein UreD [Mesocricetibacter intestinalis]TDQ56797.1 urease accessory protein [Mesocricetibacter intestinalis]
MQSRLRLSTKCNAAGKTQLEDYFASPPFKVLTLPNYQAYWPQGLNAIQMSSSPGLLGGDELDIEIRLAQHTALSLTTQAFTRVQSMHPDQYAVQHTRITMAPHSRLFYLPHPLVLHKDSALQQTTEIRMGAGCRLIYGEISIIGRVLMNGERFAFRDFNSLLKLYREDKLLLSDRIRWQPASMDLTALIQMENYSHQGSLIYFAIDKSAAEIRALQSALQQQLSTSGDILFGLSQLNEEGLMLRAVAHRADELQELFAQASAYLKSLPD